ncbi:WxcM-like domain-containing protein [Candidatus Woesearchaeota archaeon]|nr:WxcM-like domain-containing protein [Candidatus Woesearchaeota archaeon]
MDIIVKKLDVKKDERGMLFEVLRSEQVNAPFGQMFITSVKPSKVKGNHYHKRKKEWFCAVSGKVTVHLIDVASGARKDVILDSKAPSLIQINPGVSHAITNNGKDEALVISYISESYDHKDPDTFSLEVVPQH